MRKLISGAALVLAATLAALPSRAATPNSVVTPQAVQSGAVLFTGGIDAPGTAKIIYTAGASGGKCVAAFLTSIDPNVHNVQFYVQRGTSRMLLDASAIPAAGGTTGVATYNLMNDIQGLSLDSDNNHYFFLNAGDQLQVLYFTNLSAGNFISVFATCADF